MSIIGVGAPDQDTIMGNIKTSNAAARQIFLHSDKIIANDEEINIKYQQDCKQTIFFR